MVVDTLMLVIMSSLTVIYSTWLFLSFLPKRKFTKEFSTPISIIIPAYNEEANIGDTLKSVISADYDDEKEVIVVDDGSKDKTSDIVKKISKKYKFVKLVKGNHQGKARAINLGMKFAKHNILITLDADTHIEKESLKKIVEPFSDKKIGAVATTLRVSRTPNILTWFQELEYAIATAWRNACDKVDGVCVLTPLSAFRKVAIIKAGGFKGDTSVEDYDLCFYMKDNNFKITMCTAAVAYSKVPLTMRGWIKQRVRWARGTIQVLRKHKDNLLTSKISGFKYYAVPSQIYWYFHAALYLPLVLYQIINGYLSYFVSYNNILSFEVLSYFIKWFTIYGMIDFIFKTVLAIYPLTFINLLVILVFFLSYGFSLFAILRFSKRISIRHIVALSLFFPYTLFVLAMFLLGIFYELFKKEKGVKWEKSK